MNLDFKSYNQRFLNGESPIVESDKANNHPLDRYRANIVRADVAEGELYWKVIGLHHLLPSENQGSNNVYFDVLDESGERITNRMTWVEKRFGNASEAIKMEKLLTEPIGNTQITASKHNVRMHGFSPNAHDKSDSVERLHTDHPDEPLPPDGLGGNTRFHHSFYVVFQQTRQGTAAVDIFVQRANTLGLGEALTTRLPFRVFTIQVFERGIVYVSNSKPDVVKDHVF